jgi:hypothetical protein
MALGSAVVFLVARRWGRPLAVRLVGVDRIHRYEHLMTARGGLLIWLVFLVPLLPDDALCALAGLSGIAFRRFMIIATVGRIPAVAAGVFAMAGLQGAPAWVWVLATVLGVALLWFGLRYRDAVETRLLHMMGRHSGHQLPAEPIPSAGSGSGDRQQTEGDRSPGDILVLEETGRRDPLVSVLTVVVTTTAAAVLIGVATGVSGLASGITLVWGTALAVLVSSAREDD